MVQQHRGRAVLPQLLRHEEPAHLGLHAERLEEIAGHHHALDRARLAVAREGVLAVAEERVVAGDRAERHVVALKLLEGVDGVGHDRQPCGLLQARVQSLARREPDEAARVAERQGPQEHRVHDAEDGGVGGQRQRDEGHRDRREAAVPRQAPGGEAQVPRPFAGRHPAPVARRLGALHVHADAAQPIDVAEQALRLAPRVGRVPAARDQVVDLRVQVEPEFAVHVGLGIGTEQPGQAAPAAIRDHRSPPGTGEGPLSMRLTAAA